MSNFFKNKVVWITGASSGIGEALAFQLSEGEANLVISSRRTTDLERVRAACKYPDRVEIIPLDLEKSGNFPQLVEGVLKRFGRIDYLFNNGGVSQRATALETKLEVDRKLMEINFFGNIALTKSVLPVFIQQQSGHLVITSSVAGKFGFFLRSSYSASKHALHGFYESLRLENLRHNIKVTLVCPGFVNTSMSQNALTADGKNHGKLDGYQKGGLTPGQCARKMLKAVKKGKEEVLFGQKEALAVYIKRFLPGIFTSLMKRRDPTD